jgi:hypothetical protein
MIWGFYGGEYEGGCLLVCSAVNTYQSARLYNPEDRHFQIKITSTEIFIYGSFYDDGSADISSDHSVEW